MFQVLPTTAGMDDSNHDDDTANNNSNPQLLLMRYILPGDGKGLWASCDVNEERRQECKTMQRKFLPLMVGMDDASTYNDMPTTREFNFQTTVANGGGGDNNNNNKPTPSLVCAPRGLAGIGGLTDHGPN
ncbi:MAG: hypothetical protein SGARI_007298, partial [Bacillariaceae sp.]